MLHALETLFEYLNSNLIFNSVIILLMNLGGKHLVREIPEGFDKLFDIQPARLFLIFCIIFIATRKIQVSIFLTIVIILILKVFLNEKSEYCIVPKTVINLDTDGDGKTSKDELIAARKMLDDYIAKI